MTLKFTKYQGTGNDFIMVDERDLNGQPLEIRHIQNLCDRRFGIGADGLIIIRNKPHVDFYVDYFNADGSQSFCGNGARCSVKFAQEIGLINNTCIFDAIDGLHKAEITHSGEVKLLMSDVQNIETDIEHTFVLDTGSPHYVRFVEQLDQHEIVAFGREIRYSDRFKKNGINVNLAAKSDECIHVITYERGVEDETFSCGTGVTAVALSAALGSNETQGITHIQTKGGKLKVHWLKNKGSFEQIYLEGPAEKVYEGSIEF